MLGQFVFYMSDFRTFARHRIWIGTALVVCGAMLEAMGIVALVPLFSLAIGQSGSFAGIDFAHLFAFSGLESAFARALALTIGFLVLIALRAGVLYHRDLYLRRLALDYVDRWRRAVLDAIRAASWASIIAQRRTDIEHTVLSDVSRLSAGNDRLLRSGATFAIIAAQLAVLAALSPAMLIFVIGLLAAFCLIGMPIISLSEKRGKQLTGRGRALHHTLGNLLTGQKLARLNNAEDAFNQQLFDAAHAVRENQLSFTRAQSATRGILSLISAAAVAATLMFGHFFLAMDLPVLLVVVIIVVRIAGAGQQILQASQATANMLPALGAIRQTVEALSRGAPACSEPKTTRQRRTAGAAALSACDIWFAHRDGEWTLRNVSLHAEPGELVALAGPSGAGKTTLLDIATGLLPPARGSIRVDDRELRDEADWLQWRSEIAYLPQDPFLFDATIGENLRWFAPDAGDAELRRAVARAELDAVIGALPDAFETRVGERGQVLSGGERQRLCLARALLRNPRLLILDEGLSAVDEACADRIMQALATQPDRPTIILVTHNRRGMSHADRVVEIGDER